MMNKMLKKNWEENKGTYIAAGMLIGVGFFVGCKVQHKIDTRNLTANIKKGMAYVPIMRERLSPIMSLADIKAELLTVPGSVVKDAIVVTVNGTHALIVG
jgi:hypothetical protein